MSRRRRARRRATTDRLELHAHLHWRGPLGAARVFRMEPEDRRLPAVVILRRGDMPHFETIAHVGPDGVVIVRAPAHFASRTVLVRLDDAPKPDAGRPRTPEERNKALEELAGSIDDPSFE